MDNIKETELRHELQELETKMQAAQAAMSELKQKIKECDPEDEVKAFDLGLEEFNLFNCMDMLDDEIAEIEEQLSEK